MNTLVTEHKVLTVEKVKILLTSFVYYMLALILLFTGITKILDPLPLINTLKLIQFLEENLVVLIATLLPLLEMGLGLLMVLKVKPKITLSAVTILFAAFFLFSIYGTIAGLEGDCGCYGSAVKSEFGIKMIIRNFILVILSLYISFDRIILARKNK